MLAPVALLLPVFKYKCRALSCFIESSSDLITEVPATNRKRSGDTIVLHNAKVSDSAVYQCEASNKHGRLLSNANIMIMSKYNGIWFSISAS